MGRIEKTKQRLRSVVDDDRKERAEQQGFRAASCDGEDRLDEASSRAERVARNMALIRTYESRND